MITMTIKMMGVIYRAFKENKLPNTTDEDINTAYTLLKKNQWEFKNYHHEAWEQVQYLKNAVDAIISGNYEEADVITSRIKYINWC